eukprot:CAMPEP_0198422920 /NCGR_PEP_ID=MMETSP1452-20131203/2713_1 /TAXON_ID=1181717 /ORGANISM="Synchroma pusillum, Strain CCMP3072" /LENGTH=37 /DNA_ID= /DNA_START= /DNA_END= /DNA_ORIENTATION=
MTRWSTQRDRCATGGQCTNHHTRAHGTQGPAEVPQPP